MIPREMTAPEGWVVCVLGGKECLRPVTSYEEVGATVGGRRGMMMPYPSLRDNEILERVLGDERPYIIEVARDCRHTSAD